MDRLKRRHSAEVTVDRLMDHLDRWPEAFAGRVDDVGRVIYILHGIADADLVEAR